MGEDFLNFIRTGYVDNYVLTTKEKAVCVFKIWYYTIAIGIVLNILKYTFVFTFDISQSNNIEVITNPNIFGFILLIAPLVISMTFLNPISCFKKRAVATSLCLLIVIIFYRMYVNLNISLHVILTICILVVLLLLYFLCISNAFIIHLEQWWNNNRRIIIIIYVILFCGCSIQSEFSILWISEILQRLVIILILMYVRLSLGLQFSILFQYLLIIPFAILVYFLS